MKRLFATFVLVLTTSSLALAQGAPPPPPPPGGEGPKGPPPGDSMESRMRDRARPRGPMGPGEGDGPGPGGPGARNEKFEQMRNYFGVVDAFSRQSRDASQAGIHAVIAAGDILKPRGTDAAIEYFSKLLPEVKNPAVQRAVRVQLADLYKAAGKQDQALEQLRALIVAEPTESDLKALENTPPPPRPNP